MPELRTIDLHLGLSSEGVALLRMGGWRGKRRQVIAQRSRPSSGVEGLAAELGSLLSEHRCTGARTRVVLADELTRAWMVTPPPNATRLADCRAAVEARFQATYGDDVADWRLAVDWDLNAPFLACAIPNALVEPLVGVAREQGLRLIGIVPHFVAAWNGWSTRLAAGEWLAVAQGRTLSLGVAGSRRRLGALRRVTLDLAEDGRPGGLGPIVAREALRLGISPPLAVRCCGDVSPDWLQELHPGPRISRLDEESACSDTEAVDAGSSALRLASAGTVA